MQFSLSLPRLSANSAVDIPPLKKANKKLQKNMEKEIPLML